MSKDIILDEQKFDYKEIRKKRGAGVLMHITSLPGKYGIGSLGKEAREFANFLRAAGQKYWQILPVGPTGYGDSPYQSFSSYAGNPFIIDLENLRERGLIYDQELALYEREETGKVDFSNMNQERMEVLKLAFSRFDVEDLDYQDFIVRNNFWLKDYALYMAIKDNQEGVCWQEWEEAYKFRDRTVLKKFEAENPEAISFYIFIQYIFFSQWEELKAHLHRNSIQTIGDLPIYVAEDSADVWANPELFKLDEDLKPIVVGGVPPDAFTDDGQLWGNPVYDWKVHEYTNFTWWIDRIKWNFSIFDLVRLDHFRGFESYWEVPFGDKTARNGKWAEGPGIKLFNKVKEELGDLPVIAEDLGIITPAVEKLLEDTGFPGMSVLQFAFSPSAKSEHLPHNAVENSVMYTGTHDNDTILGWVENFKAEDIEFAKKYLNLTEEEGITWGMIRGAFTSVSRIAVIQMQDLLYLDNSARMNLPGTLGNNWVWRMKKNQLKDDIIVKLREMTRMSGRI